MKKAWKAIIGVLAVVLVLLLVAEAGIRMYLSNQITSGFAQQPGAEAAGDPKVSFGSSPVVFGLLGGTLPHITVDAPSTLFVNGNDYTGNPAATIQLEKVHITGGEPVAPIVEVDGEGVARTAVKQAADRSGDLVVRVHEALGGRTRGRVRFAVPATDVRRANLLEEPLPDAGLEPDADGWVSFDLGAFEVATLRATPPPTT